MPLPDTSSFSDPSAFETDLIDSEDHCSCEEPPRGDEGCGVACVFRRPDECCVCLELLVDALHETACCGRYIHTECLKGVAECPLCRGCPWSEEISKRYAER